MTRTDLEVRLIAHAIVQPGRRREMLDALDRDQVSAACWALLAQLAAPDAGMHAATVQQRRLADLAEAVTVAQLLDWPSDVLVETINRGDWQERPVRAWERDLQRATGAAA